YGANWPFWRTWTDHAKLRGLSRLLYGMSYHCQGALGGLGSYVLGTGITYQATTRPGKDAPADLLFAVQRVLDRFIEANQFGFFEEELFVRSR
ncbi:hypothetical protein ABTN33_19360, partial [Acinetobacter baumannii]